jgi:hypothetical protein
MIQRRRFLSASLIAIPLICYANSNAQERGNPPTTKAAGTIKTMRGNIMHIVGDEGEQLYVQAPNSPQYVSYSGSAAPNFLQRGMFVRFKGAFDKKGKSQGLISKMEIFTPKPPPQGEQPNLDDVPGVYPDEGLGGELFSDVSESKPKTEAKSFRIVGRVTAVKDEKLTVAAGRVTVQVEVDENAAISVNVADWRLARIGDKVAADGWYYPQQKNNIYASRLSIVGSEKLGAVEKK